MEIYFIIGISSLLIGILAGFFIGKIVIKKYVEQNSMINEEMITMMLAQTGKKPSKKKVAQIMKAVNEKKKNEPKEKLRKAK